MERTGDGVGKLLEVVPRAIAHDAAIVSTLSGSLGGQNGEGPLALKAWAWATLSTTTSGPGDSAMPGSVYSCLPRLPPVDSQTVMVPVAKKTIANQ